MINGFLCILFFSLLLLPLLLLLFVFLLSQTLKEASLFGGGPRAGGRKGVGVTVLHYVTLSESLAGGSNHTRLPSFWGPSTLRFSFLFLP